jgi:uncharacterized protein (TIGR03083 family)
VLEVQTQQTNKSYTSTDLARACRESRERTTALVLELPAGALDTPVPTCPGWSVRDVIAHLAGNAEDMAAEPFTVPPSDEQTAAQVARLRGRSIMQLLDDWDRDASLVEGRSSAAELRMPLIDIVSHEHDIRAAVGRPGARDSEGVRITSQSLLRSLRPAAALRVVVEDAEFRAGPEEGPELVLTTSRFEALRWRMGRRSRAQLAAMQWSGDPTPVLGSLMVFGPAAADVVE